MSLEAYPLYYTINLVLKKGIFL